MKKALFVAVLSVLALPSLALASIDINLKYGSRGGEVTELQEFLISKNLLQGTATGNFFSLTRAAVIAYQKAENISPVSGFVGPITRGKINEELALDDTQAANAEISETGTTTTPTQTSEIDLLKQQNTLMKQQLGQQQEIIKNTTPPAPPQPTPLTITFGTQTCKTIMSKLSDGTPNPSQSIKTPFTTTGDWKYLTIQITNTSKGYVSGGAAFSSDSTRELNWDPNTYEYTAKFYDDVLSLRPDAKLIGTINGTVTVNPCI